ncbi:MAG: hypothetical protein U0R44_05400 [Candidatus Micrarchaeia archaeon]
MKIALRADPEPAHGFQRCLALGSGFKETSPDSEIILISNCTASQTRLIEEAGLTHLRPPAGVATAWEAEELLEVISGSGIDLLVLDIEYDESGMRSLKEKTVLAVFDDQARCKKYSAHAVVNPNPNAHLLEYRTDPDTELFLGTEFAALPADFDRYQEFRREHPQQARHIFIHFPGKDSSGAVLRCVRALKGLADHFSATVMLDQDSSKGADLATEAGLDGRFIIIQHPDHAKRLCGADIALVPPQYLPQVAALSVPSILIYDRTSPLAEYAARTELALCLGPAAEPEIASAVSRLVKDTEGRRRMSARMSELVDCMGRFRLADELLRILKEKKQTL